MPFFRVKSKWLWFSIFCIAMAFMESAVVIYLRELYYPGGFNFPLAAMPVRIASTEFLREIATLIMLLTAGYLAGHNLRQRFAWFIFGFAVWDIFYYVFLKLLIQWPGSWLTWDILFLIPVIWTAPVIAPILVSLTMIALSVSLLHTGNKPAATVIRWPVIFLVSAGALIIFLSFIQDFSLYIINLNSLPALFHNGITSGSLEKYIPGTFNWILFLAGEVAEIAAIILIIMDPRKQAGRFHYF